MRIESSVTSVSWIPEGSVSGLARVPFSLGVTHYDDRPRTRLGDIDALRADPNVREVNRLEAWIEVHDGRINRSGYGRNSGFVGSTCLDLGVTRVTVSGRARPVLRRRPLVSAQTARFVQTIGGRTGMRRRRGPRWSSRFTPMDERTGGCSVPAHFLAISFTTRRAT